MILVFRPAFQAWDEADVAFDGEVREQAALLDHVADTAAKADAVPFSGSFAVHADFARGGQDHAVDEAQGGGFAGAAAAEKDQSFAGFDGERQAVEDGSTADAKVDIAKFDGAHFAFWKSVSANPHSDSTHCRTQDHPARLPMREISSARNLCEDSVQTVSPAENGTVRSSASIRTAWAMRERRCISILDRRSLKRASWAN